jgi:hypothetical protein
VSRRTAASISFTPLMTFSLLHTVGFAQPAHPPQPHNLWANRPNSGNLPDTALWEITPLQSALRHLAAQHATSRSDPTDCRSLGSGMNLGSGPRWLFSVQTQNGRIPPQFERAATVPPRPCRSTGTTAGAPPDTRSGHIAPLKTRRLRSLQKGDGKSSSGSITIVVDRAVRCFWHLACWQTVLACGRIDTWAGRVGSKNCAANRRRSEHQPPQFPRFKISSLYQILIRPARRKEPRRRLLGIIPYAYWQCGCGIVRWSFHYLSFYTVLE